MPNYRIKSEDEDTYFFLRAYAGSIQIMAVSKLNKFYPLASIAPETGALKLATNPEYVFEELGIDYKKRDSGGGYIWNVEE